MRASPKSQGAPNAMCHLAVLAVLMAGCTHSAPPTLWELVEQIESAAPFSQSSLESALHTRLEQSKPEPGAPLEVRDFRLADGRAVTIRWSRVQSLDFQTNGVDVRVPDYPNPDPPCFKEAEVIAHFGATAVNRNLGPSTGPGVSDMPGRYVEVDRPAGKWSFAVYVEASPCIGNLHLEAALPK